MEWIENANAILGLICTLVGLVTAGVPLGIMVYNLFKNKNKAQIWTMIMTMADAAMVEAEKSGKSGADKKQMVIDSVTAACKSQGIDVGPFAVQVANYIDQCVAFANNLNK